MKTICSTLIGIHYKEHLLPLVDDTPNLQHYYDTISNNIKTLFHKSLYLQGGLDENVSLVISYIFIYEMLTFFRARLVISPTRSSVTSAKNFIFKAKTAWQYFFPTNSNPYQRNAWPWPPLAYISIPCSQVIEPF